MKIGSTIRKCRQIRGMTLESLAIEIGLSKSYLSLVETNKRELSLSYLKNIAVALNIPLPLLIYLASEPEEINEMNKKFKLKFDELIIKLIKND